MRTRGQSSTGSPVVVLLVSSGRLVLPPVVPVVSLVLSPVLSLVLSLVLSPVLPPVVPALVVGRGASLLRVSAVSSLSPSSAPGDAVLVGEAALVVRAAGGEDRGEGEARGGEAHTGLSNGASRFDHGARREAATGSARADAAAAPRGVATWL